MARIVLGLGTSHSPQLSTPPDVWPLHAERDKANPELWGKDGQVHRYEELVATADPSISKELTPEKWQARYEACQKAIATLGEILRRVSPDIVVIVGDDQKELFHEDNMPALAIYWGETIANIPSYGYGPEAHPSQRAAAWAYAGETEEHYPVASALGKHLIEFLIDAGYDVAHSRYLKPGQGEGHAFGFVHRRLMNGNIIPVVPVMVNTYYPPNQPTPRRCYELGRALRAAIEAWETDARVAVVASGGLSHFVIDEELDQQVIKALQDRDVTALCSLPREKLNSGTSEIRNWIVGAGATEHLEMKLIDYVPCYRSPAGTGCAMGFAQWS